jgi:uncharacterized protein
MNTIEEFVEAIKEGDFHRVQQMIEQDPSLTDAKSSSGVSAILLALYYGSPAIAELLIAQDASLDIFEAAAAGKLNRVRLLLDEQPSLVNAFASDGFQPLGLAAFFGHAHIVELLLARGAEVNSASANAQRVMPLHSAVAGQHVEVARMLLEHGADVNAKQQDEFTPLHEAAQNGQLEMIQLLLAFGAKKDQQKSDGQTAFSIALEKGFSEAADLLKR